VVAAAGNPFASALHARTNQCSRSCTRAPTLTRDPTRRADRCRLAVPTPVPAESVAVIATLLDHLCGCIHVCVCICICICICPLPLGILLLASFTSFRTIAGPMPALAASRDYHFARGTFTARLACIVLVLEFAR
jgi:hypothetical protein